MGWTPPLTLEEKLKKLFVPNALQRHYHIRRELKKGEAEIHLVRFLADRAKVSLDIGANRGVWANVMADYSSKVIAFEPNPKMFALLKAYSDSRIESYPYALSNQTGRTRLMVPKGRKGYSNQGASLSQTKIGAGHFSEVEVQSYRLDDLGISNVGFIKIDVEGYELEVLQGAKQTIANSRPTLIVEIEEKHVKRPIQDLLDDVCSYGYECFALRHGSLVRQKHIDLAKHHSQVADRKNYIFNWVFLPL